MTGGRALGVAFAALAIVALGAATRVPWTASPSDHALLRLSWRARSVVAEHCRSLTEAEKADLPVHMQVPEVCETHAIPYILETTIDGVAVPADTIHGAGARDDRPVIVFREIPLAVGAHTVEVAFRPLVDPGEIDQPDDDRGHEGSEDGDHNGDEHEERDEEVDHGEDNHGEDNHGDDDHGDDEDGDEDEAIVLAFSETLRLGPREVALVTLDPERGSLIRVEPAR